MLLWLHEQSASGAMHTKQLKQEGTQNSANKECFQRHRVLWQRKLTLFPESLEAKQTSALSTAVVCVTFCCFLSGLFGVFLMHYLDKTAAKYHSFPPKALVFLIPVILYNFWAEPFLVYYPWNPSRDALAAWRSILWSTPTVSIGFILENGLGRAEISLLVTGVINVMV